MTSSSSTSWVKRRITSPFRKACTFFNHHNHHSTSSSSSSSSIDHNNNKSRHQGHDDKRMIDLQLQGEVMACAYEDVQVMWSILDKSNS